MAFQKASKIILSQNVVLEDGISAAAIGILDDGTISDIATDFGNLPTNIQVQDFGDLYILPGLVDSHVHVNEPGRTEWEGFWSATRAAASGGVTTIVDMPLNSIPPTTTVANFEEKLKHCAGKLHTDVAFWGGLVPSNKDSLLPLVEAGVVGFKCFLCPSGVDEFPNVSWDDVRTALQSLKGSETVLAFHAEYIDCQDESNKTAKNQSVGGADNYNTFLESRPENWETTAVEKICKLCSEHRVKCHVVHASSSDVVAKIRETRKTTGAKLSVETCYHYLTLNSENIPKGGTMYKCCPPIRTKKNQDELWAFIKSGDIDLVVSDHSPCTPELKGDSDFMAAWGGISSVQFGLSLLWTAAASRGLTLDYLSELVSSGPSKLCRLDNKGSLTVGKDADIVIFDPNLEWTIAEDGIYHKHKVTPYLGRTLKGRVIQTFLRGQSIYRLGEEFPEPSGKTILLNK